MTSITYVGLDVHTTNYTAACYRFETDNAFAVAELKPKAEEIVKYLARVKKNLGENCEFLCGYEAGCLGYSLYHELTAKGIKCVIMAPSTIESAPANKIKTDKRDAMKLAKCLGKGAYKAVYVPTDEDNAVKEYIRMRDDVNNSLKRVKQQITAFCIRNGKTYKGVVGKSYWTKKHLNWLEKLEFNQPVLREALEEYIAVFYVLCEKIETFDAKIEALSQTERFREPVKKVSCLSGIATHTAMATISEISDFTRFPSANSFAAYLGLVPGEYSSSNNRHQLGITKQGNNHVRRLLTEAAQSYTKGQIGKKSAALKKRQTGMDPKIIAYCDKCAERLKRKYIRISLHSKSNIAKTAIARELACFIWGLMTDNYGESRGNMENRPKLC